MLILYLLIFNFSFQLTSAEAIVETIVGFLVTWGLTSYLKDKTGFAALGATILAVIVSFIVATVALIVSTLFSGQEISLDSVISRAPQIFILATLAYRSAQAVKK